MEKKIREEKGGKKRGDIFAVGISNERISTAVSAQQLMHIAGLLR